MNILLRVFLNWLFTIYTYDRKENEGATSNPAIGALYVSDVLEKVR